MSERLLLAVWTIAATAVLAWQPRFLAGSGASRARWAAFIVLTGPAVPFGLLVGAWANRVALGHPSHPAAVWIPFAGLIALMAVPAFSALGGLAIPLLGRSVGGIGGMAAVRSKVLLLSGFAGGLIVAVANADDLGRHGAPARMVLYGDAPDWFERLLVTVSCFAGVAVGLLVAVLAMALHEAWVWTAKRRAALRPPQRRR